MRRVILTVTGTIVGLVLLLSFKTSSGVGLANRAVVVPTTGGTATGSPGDATATASPGASPATGSVATGSAATGSAATGPAATGPAASRTITGTAVDTRYGPVQVAITMKNGVITSAQAVTYPENSGRDEQINAYAIPVLNTEAEQADSANIDMVSGATYTSDGYVQSLQSALDKA